MAVNFTLKWEEGGNRPEAKQSRLGGTAGSDFEIGSKILSRTP